MTFSEGMQIDTSRATTSGGSGRGIADRRRCRRPGDRTAGAVSLGVDPGQVIPATGAGPGPDPARL